MSHKKIYEFEGKAMTFAEIHKRVPAISKTVLRRRLDEGFTTRVCMLSRPVPKNAPYFGTSDVFGNRTMGTGSPKEIANWAHEVLGKRKCDKPYALVMENQHTALLVDSHSGKSKRIESLRPHDIVGHYCGHHKRPPRVTVEDLEADIRMTLEGV